MPRLSASFIGLLGAVLFTPFVSYAQPAPALDVAARAYVVGHPASGRILMSKEADTRLEPASLTKLMTLYIIFDQLKSGNLRLEDDVMVSERAWRKGGSKMFIEVGKTAKVDDLIRGISVSSGNDACIAMAEHLAGSEEGFAALMNTKAKSLGMHNTTFKNASGWPDAEQLTTARDMYLLAAAIQRDFPDYYHYFSIQSFTYNNITQANRNGLLRRDNSVDGMKTGHIESAGYHLVSSAQRNDNRVISVMMGTTSERSRENESMKVLGWAFTQFDHYTALRSGDTVEQAAPVWMGARPQVPLVAAEDVTLFLSRAERGKVSAEVVYQSPLKAPLQKGQQVGKIIIRGEGPDMPEISVPALVAVDVPELGFLGKLIATVANKFGN